MVGLIIIYILSILVLLMSGLYAYISFKGTSKEERIEMIKDVKDDLLNKN